MKALLCSRKFERVCSRTFKYWKMLITLYGSAGLQCMGRRVNFACRRQDLLYHISFVVVFFL